MYKMNSQISNLTTAYITHLSNEYDELYAEYVENYRKDYAKCLDYALETYYELGAPNPDDKLNADLDEDERLREAYMKKLERSDSQ